MGCSFSFICKTCRKDYLLGYGAYGGWLIYPKTVEDYDELAKNQPKKARFEGNRNIRKCLVDHSSHDIEYLYHGIERLEEIVGNPGEYEHLDLSAVE